MASRKADPAAPAVIEAAPPAAPPPVIVTGFVDCGNGHRPTADYVALGEQLLALGLPTICWMDEAVHVKAPASTTLLPATFEDCWLAGKVSQDVQLPSGANPEKDTLAYLVCQHEKSRWIADAFQNTEADLAAWVDFGVMHVRGVGPREIKEFYDRLPHARRDVIIVASIWGPPAPDVPTPQNLPAWHCAGGVLIVPRALADRFALLVEQAAARQIENGHLAWEVNTWAIVWQQNPELFTSYHCDHSAGLFEGFQP
jgi:hypothetical protein